MRWRALSAFGLATSLLLSVFSLALLLTVRAPAPLGAALDRPGGAAVPGQVALQNGPVTADVWSWLAATAWYVPAVNLLAVRFAADQQTLIPTLDQTVYRLTGFSQGYFWGPTAARVGNQALKCLSLADQQTLIPTLDQTVYRLTGFSQGYFWGPTAARVGNQALKCLSLVGSVTPEGALQLTFTPQDPNPGTVPTQGIGQMRKVQTLWTMENQMSSGPTRLQISHWAYMVQGLPSDPAWQSLPGVGISGDALLAQCPQGPSLVGP